VRSAARIARTFRQDPIAVLDATPFEWLVRIAAHNIVVADEDKAAAKKTK
jgi:hypothetical protein